MKNKDSKPHIGGDDRVSQLKDYLRIFKQRTDAQGEKTENFAAMAGSAGLMPCMLIVEFLRIKQDDAYYYYKSSHAFHGDTPFVALNRFFCVETVAGRNITQNLCTQLMCNTALITAEARELTAFANGYPVSFKRDPDRVIRELMGTIIQKRHSRKENDFVIKTKDWLSQDMDFSRWRELNWDRQHLAEDEARNPDFVDVKALKDKASNKYMNALSDWHEQFCVRRYGNRKMAKGVFNAKILRFSPDAEMLRKADFEFCDKDTEGAYFDNIRKLLDAVGKNLPMNETALSCQAQAFMCEGIKCFAPELKKVRSWKNWLFYVDRLLQTESGRKMAREEKEEYEKARYATSYDREETKGLDKMTPATVDYIAIALPLFAPSSMVEDKKKGEKAVRDPKQRFSVFLTEFGESLLMPKYASHHHSDKEEFDGIKARIQIKEKQK